MFACSFWSGCSSRERLAVSIDAPCTAMRGAATLRGPHSAVGASLTVRTPKIAVNFASSPHHAMAMELHQLWDQTVSFSPRGFKTRYIAKLCLLVSSAVFGACPKARSAWQVPLGSPRLRVSEFRGKHISWDLCRNAAFSSVELQFSAHNVYAAQLDESRAGMGPGRDAGTGGSMHA
jgi:hypothetical protein